MMVAAHQRNYANQLTVLSQVVFYYTCSSVPYEAINNSIRPCLG